jgi:agmatinase
MSLKFADAISDFKNARFVILGIPYEGRSSFRAGSKFAPIKIREASYNLENYLIDLKTSIPEIGVCDIGDIEEAGRADTFTNIEHEICKILESKKFPILLGGEHIISYPVVKAFKSKYDDLFVIWLDAHLDFRDTYLDDRFSHACAARRVYEIVNASNILQLYIRSGCASEYEDAQKLKLHFVSSLEKSDADILDIIKKTVARSDVSNIYLSIDMDVIEPAYSPAVSTPEPMGILPQTVKECINTLAPKLAGVDIVEICPQFDTGITTMLAAKFVLYVICSVARTRL